MKKLFFILLLACICAAGADATSAQTVVTFDNLPPINSGSAAIQDGYGGINWSVGGWSYYSWSQPPYNPRSAPSRAFASQQNQESKFAFVTQNAVFSGAWFSGYGGEAVQFRLYNDGVLVHTSQSLTMSSTPTLLPSGYTGKVDEVGVVQVGTDPSMSNYYIMDNVTYKATDNVKIQLDPAPTNNIYVISDTPTMPVIKASAKVVGISPDPTDTSTFTWEVTLTTPNGSRTKIDLSSDVKLVNPLNNTNKTTGTQPIELKVNPTSALRGGSLKLTANTTVNNQPLMGSTAANLIINGKNPDTSAVRSFIDTQASSAYQGLSAAILQDTLKRMACHESGGPRFGQRQFRANPNGSVGVPLISFDNGAGIFQITLTNKCPSGIFASTGQGFCRNLIFNWKANVTEGVRVFKSEKITVVKTYPSQLRNGTTFAKFITDTVNPARVAAGITPLPDTKPLSFVPEYNSEQLLYDAIRYYNGFGSGRIYSFPLHEYRPNVNNLKSKTVMELKDPLVFWERVPGTASERPGTKAPNYVNIVLNTPATCSAAAAFGQDEEMLTQGIDTQEPASDSRLAPTISVKAGTKIIELKFPVALDPEQAVDAARYTVRHNLSQSEIESVTYDAETHSVSLLINRRMYDWDEVIVGWELIDLYANPLKGEEQRIIGARAKIAQ